MEQHSNTVQQDRQCFYNRNIEERPCSHCCSGKATLITHSECVSVALVTRHAKRMRRTNFILPPVQLYHIFPRYFINITIFGKTLLNIKRVFWFSLQLLYETFLILKRNSVRWPQMYIHRHVQYTLFLSDFNETSWKSVQWEPSCSMRTRTRTGGRTDGRRDEVNNLLS